jgi:hypothetical protein
MPSASLKAVGAAIMISGGLGAFIVFLLRVAKPERRPGSYPELGRSILLGAADASMEGDQLLERTAGLQVVVVEAAEHDVAT